MAEDSTLPRYAEGRGQLTASKLNATVDAVTGLRRDLARVAGPDRFGRPLIYTRIGRICEPGGDYEPYTDERYWVKLAKVKPGLSQTPTSVEALKTLQEDAPNLLDTVTVTNLAEAAPRTADGDDYKPGTHTLAPGTLVEVRCVVQPGPQPQTHYFIDTGGGGMVLVNCTKDGGVEGGNGVDCSFTYYITMLGGGDPVALGLTPYTPRYPKTKYNDGSGLGIARKADGEWELLHVFKEIATTQEQELIYAFSASGTCVGTNVSVTISPSTKLYRILDSRDLP